MGKEAVFRMADNTALAADELRRVAMDEPGNVGFDINLNPIKHHLDSVVEPFEYVVSTVNPPTLRNAAMHFVKNTGVGTPVLSISLTGGLKMLTTAAFTDGTTADTANIKATTASPFATRGVVYSVNSRLRFTTQINPVALTNQIILGLAQAPHATLLDVGSQGTDLVFFAFDPLNALVSGITTYATNWIACAKAASGTAEYFDTGIPVIAGSDVELSLRFNGIMKPEWYINGTMVATGTAWTVLVALLAMVGIKTSTAAAKTLHVRYCRIGRMIG